MTNLPLYVAMHNNNNNNNNNNNKKQTQKINNVILK